MKRLGFRTLRVFLVAMRGFRYAVTPLLDFEVFFRLISFSILGPFSAWLISALISTTGHLSLSNEQILSFFLSPLGIITIVISGAVVLSILYLQQGGFMIIGSGALRGQRVAAARGLWLTVRRMPGLLGLAGLQSGVYLLFFLPFAALLGLTYSLLLSDYDISYLLAETPPVFWVAVTIAGVLTLSLLLLYAYLYVRWTFALPACLFEGKRFSTPLRGSARLVKGSFFRIASTLLGWAVMTGTVAVITVVLFDYLSGVLLSSLGENLNTIILVAAGLVTLILVSLEAIFFVGLTINCLLIIHLYHDIRSRKGMPLLKDAIYDHQEHTGSRVRGTLVRLAPWGVAALILVVTGSLAYLKIENLDLTDRVSVTAHRGSSKRAPENTISAVQKAVDDKADFAEIDVQETADGVIVLLHDEDLMRVAGLNRKIWDTTYAELENLDAGSWFSPAFRGERIPTLQEVMEVARDRIKLNIELKFNGHDQMLAERVVKLIQDQDFASQCVISSLNYEGLLEVRRTSDELKVGYIIFEAVGDISRLDVDFLSVKSSLVTPRLIDATRKRDREVHVWTVNDPRRMGFFIDLGVSNIITDDPDVLVAMLDARATLSDVERLLLKFTTWLERKGLKATSWKVFEDWLKSWLPIKGRNL